MPPCSSGFSSSAWNVALVFPCLGGFSHGFVASVQGHGPPKLHVWASLGSCCTNSSNLDVVQKKKPLISMNKQTFPIQYLFLILVPTELPETVFFHKRPASGCPYKFRSRGTTGSSMFDHDLGHVCRGRRNHISGHSDFGIVNNYGASSIVTWVQADTASAACPAQPGNLAITSITFSAVICEADDPCSVNTAYATESSFTMPLRSTTLPLYFCDFRFRLSVLEVTNVHQCSKVHFLCDFCASSITSFLLLIFSSCHAGIVSSFCHSLSTAAFASGIFIA